MGFRAGRHERGRRARVACAAGLVVLVGAVPAMAGSADEGGIPIDPDDPWAPFEFARNQPDGPVISGSSESSTIADTIGATERSSAADRATTGAFGKQVAWPVIPLHAVLTPDGRVLTYGTNRQGDQTAYYQYDIWNPSTRIHDTLRNRTLTDLFCSAQIVLPNGAVQLYGGDTRSLASNDYNRDVNHLPLGSNKLVKSGERVPGSPGQMHLKRWYATSTVMPNGEVLLQGGWGQGYVGDPVRVAYLPEVRGTDRTFRILYGAEHADDPNYYPRNFVAPDGLVFGIADDTMYRLDPAGLGSIESLGTFSGENRGPSSSAVMFRPGKILQVGGGVGDLTYNASKRASIIDINSGSPQVTAAPDMQYRRHWGTATVMADGRVMVSGGSKQNNGAVEVAYTAEIYDPQTNTWSTAATARRMRLYHSTSLLLPDASVLTMGGGSHGPENNLNAEIYYPPYLYNADGSPAARPTISAATTATNPGGIVTVNSPQASSISRVTLVKTGSVTHSFDMDQRFFDLPFTRSGGKLQAVLPTNTYETPPGYYHVFVFDANGVPSKSRIVKVNVAPQLPPPPVNLVLNGGFEANAVPGGEAANLRPLAGWTNGTRPIETWRRYSGYTPKSGASNVELDYRGAGNRLDQRIATRAGRPYTLSFWTSPRPGATREKNRFDLYWNGTKLSSLAYDGVGLSNTSWKSHSYTVVGTGNDVLSFREHDAGGAGALFDNVRLVRQ